MKYYRYLMFGIIGIFLSSLIFSAIAVQGTSIDNNDIPIPDSASGNLSDIYITNADRLVDVGKFGLINVYDTLTIFNNGTDATGYIQYTIYDKIESKLRYLSAQSKAGASLVVQDLLNKLNGYKTFTIYFNTPLLPNSTIEIIVKSTFSNLIRITGSYSEQICYLDFSIIPFLPYAVITLTSGIRAPTGSTLATFTPDSTNIVGTKKIYSRSDVSAFSNENVTAQWTYNSFPILEFISIERNIEINTWGVMTVIEHHTIKNTGLLTVSSFDYKIPATATNLVGRDGVGTITGITLAATANSDGLTKNVTVNLANNRARLEGNSSVYYYLTYNLPIENYVSRGLTSLALKIDINLVESELLIRNQKTYIHLFGGSKIIDASLNPEQINYDSESLILEFTDTNIIQDEEKFIYIQYQEDVFQSLYRPFIYSFLLLLAFGAYAYIRTQTRGKEEDISDSGAKIVPDKEIREFISMYEELNAIRIDLQQLEDDLDRKKIAKKMYIKQKKTLEDKQKLTKEEIKPFKKALIDEGERYGEIVQKLDVKEAELLSNQDSIALHEDRYRKGKLPSKQAYVTLKEQMEKNNDKIQKDIDKLVNELKAYLL